VKEKKLWLINNNRFKTSWKVEFCYSFF